jgi:hypothetical protein
MWPATARGLIVPTMAEKVRAVRAVVAEYETEHRPFKLYRDQNLGCEKGVSWPSRVLRARGRWHYLRMTVIRIPTFSLPVAKCSKFPKHRQCNAGGGVQRVSGTLRLTADYRLSHHGWQSGWALSAGLGHISTCRWPVAGVQETWIAQCAAFDNARSKCLTGCMPECVIRGLSVANAMASITDCQLFLI